jgi:acylphosphatase
VRNAPDGSVEVMAEGPDRDLDTLERKLGQGPPGAEVRDVTLLHAPDLPLPDPFRIVR